MSATAPCGLSVIPYSLSVGPRGAAAGAARFTACPAGTKRTEGAARVWEKMLAATMDS